MAPRDQVIALLRGPEAGRIRFVFPTASGNVTIGAGTFHHVARAVESRRVRVTVTNTFPAGVAGQYVQPNELQVRPMLGRVDLGLVLHECTHAAYDLLRTGITAWDEEASCYVVNALYFRMTGVAPSRWSASTHAMAGAVADDLLHQYARGTAGIPTVSRAAWEALRAVVLASPIYTFVDAAHNDFRPGMVATGGSYTHDG
jgi:hypothetical protein